MTRICYSDEEYFPGQSALWHANCRRSIQGKKGQVALRELEAALLALPEKRLIAGALQDDDGEVCALGALAQYQGIDCAIDMEDVGEELGLPRLVAWKVVDLNDDLDWKWEKGERRAITPEERYEAVLKAVQRWLTPADPQRESKGDE